MHAAFPILPMALGHQACVSRVLENQVTTVGYKIPSVLPLNPLKSFALFYFLELRAGFLSDCIDIFEQDSRCGLGTCVKGLHSPVLQGLHHLSSHLTSDSSPLSRHHSGKVPSPADFWVLLQATCFSGAGPLSGTSLRRKGLSTLRVAVGSHGAR